MQIELLFVFCNYLNIEPIILKSLISKDSWKDIMLGNFNISVLLNGKLFYYSGSLFTKLVQTCITAIWYRLPKACCHVIICFVFHAFNFNFNYKYTTSQENVNINILPPVDVHVDEKYKVVQVLLMMKIKICLIYVCFWSILRYEVWGFLVL